MSTTTQPSPPAVSQPPETLVVVSHSPLFYWWPVWAVGFVMAALTWWHGYQVAFVPLGTVAERGVRVEGHDGPRDVLIVPKGQSLPAEIVTDELMQPRLRMTPSNNFGVIWALTLCFVVVSTHLQLRGLWSVLVVAVLFFATILLAVFGLWDPILRVLQIIDIHMNAFGYLSISLFLFIIWLVTFLFFDRQVYAIFTRGQLRVRLAIGAGETVYDTRGMVVERHRDDLFRHWLLGFGSGDLTIHTAGTSPRKLELPNVLNIGHKLELIHLMLQEREVVRGSR